MSTQIGWAVLELFVFPCGLLCLHGSVPSPRNPELLLSSPAATHGPGLGPQEETAGPLGRGKVENTQTLSVHPVMVRHQDRSSQGCAQFDGHGQHPAGDSRRRKASALACRSKPEVVGGINHFLLGRLRLHDESLRNPRCLLRYHLPTRGPILEPQGQSAGPCVRTKVQHAVQSRASIGARLCCRGPWAAQGSACHRELHRH